VAFQAYFQGSPFAMQTVVIVIHLLLAVALVITVLLQQSEGGALGIGGGNMGGLMTGRGAANALTRVTGVLAAGFFVTSIILTILARGSLEAPSILDSAQETPTTAPAPEVPSVPSSQ
jgi:preprotein translocase subunit SecG